MTSSFHRAFDRAFGSDPAVFQPPPSTVSLGPLATSPYADQHEHVEPQEYPTAPQVFTKMAPSDARAIEIFLDPPHRNYVPNPACRADPSHQWAGSFTVVNDAWVGRGLRVDAANTIRQRVYVGPSDAAQQTSGDWYEPGPSGSEYAFSLYAKGDADIQLSMYGFRPDDDGNPEVSHAAEQHSPFLPTDVVEWQRHSIKTESRLRDISGQIPDFSGCWWIDVEVEVMSGTAILSAFMLDPSEGPLCEYFDGSLDDAHHERDDFMWLGAENDSVSVYYPERIQRVHWLWTHIYMVAPVNRPVAIYFHDRAHPWEPDSPAVRFAIAPSINSIDRRLAHTY